MKTLYNKLCYICHNPFSYYKYPSVEKPSPRITCSEKCRLLLVSIRLSGRFIPNGNNEKRIETWKTVRCKQCNIAFTVPRSRKRKFCSVFCKAEWQKENLKGKNNPNWKPLDERKPFRSVSHKVRKLLISERKVCEHCGIDKLLQVHHKNRNRGNNQPDNLLLLCKSCHSKEHELSGEFNAARLINAHPQQTS